MDYLLLILIAVAITVWWFKTRSGISSDIEAKSKEISHDEVIKLQLDFEHQLESDFDLPDGIRGKDAYIYWHLMRKWFSKLTAENRYNQEILGKIQRDWCFYLDQLPKMKRARFLAMELEDRQKADKYDQRADQTVRSIEGIQDTFASLIGPQAVEELCLIRNQDTDAFDRTGKRVVAPAGHHYFPVSINPYIEECRPKNNA